MEVNEKELKEDKISLLDDVFKFDYENQNIKNNIDFKKWKAKIKKENTNKIKIYKCNDCKICFYVNVYEDSDYDEYYYSSCPICKKEICYFCYQNIKGLDSFSRYLRGYCCLKRLISFIFFREKFSDNSYPISNFILGYIAFIIPFINSTALILCIIQNLFCFKATKKNKNNSYSDYYLFEKKSFKYFTFIKVINVCFAFCCSISYLSLTLVFMVITFLFSIPFKMTPLTNLIFYIAENAVDNG